MPKIYGPIHPGRCFWTWDCDNPPVIMMRDRDFNIQTEICKAHADQTLTEMVSFGRWSSGVIFTPIVRKD